MSPWSPWKLREAARIITAGGVIAYPTEAVYGLGCDPRNEAAVARVLKLKGRSSRKGLILIASDFDQLREFVEEPEDRIRQRLWATWPGPVTWVLKARDNVVPLLCGTHDTLAVRVTAYAPVANLCRFLATPLVSTSANRSGRPAVRSALAVRKALGPELDLILVGPVGGHKLPSEIRDGETGRVLRSG